MLEMGFWFDLVVDLATAFCVGSVWVLRFPPIGIVLLTGSRVNVSVLYLYVMEIISNPLCIITTPELRCIFFTVIQYV